MVFSILAALVSAAATLIASILSLPLWILIPSAVIGAVASGLIVWGLVLWYRADRAQKLAQRRAQDEAWHKQQEAARQAWLRQQDEAERALQVWLARLRTLEGLRALTPREFEHAVGQMLTTHGYLNVIRTGGAGDLMADLTCTTAEGRSVVVQCKRYGADHAVGSPEIQKFIGMVTVHHRAHIGIFVTSSSFTEPAKRLAEQHRSYLQLIDGEGLAAMMQSVQAATK